MHARKGKTKANLVPPLNLKCPEYYKVFDDRSAERKEVHKCGEYLCTSCEKYVQEEHLCYLRVLEAKEKFNDKFKVQQASEMQDEALQCIFGYYPDKKENLYGLSTRETMYILLQIATLQGAMVWEGYPHKQFCCSAYRLLQIYS